MKTKTEHTPGPWHINTLEKSPHTVHAAGGCVAECHGRPEKPVSGYSTAEREANARLIARAPEMEQEIEKLKEALREVYEDWATLTGKDLAENNADVARIDALVRAALGA